MYDYAINKEADRRSQETKDKKETADRKASILEGLLGGSRRRVIGGKKK